MACQDVQVDATPSERGRFKATDSGLIESARGLASQANWSAAKHLPEFHIFTRAAAQVEAEHVAELQHVGEEFEFLPRTPAQ